MGQARSLGTARSPDTLVGPIRVGAALKSGLRHTHFATLMGFCATRSLMATETPARTNTHSLPDPCKIHFGLTATLHPGIRFGNVIVPPVRCLVLNTGPAAVITPTLPVRPRDSKLSMLIVAAGLQYASDGSTQTPHKRLHFAGKWVVSSRCGWDWAHTIHWQDV